MTSNKIPISVPRTNSLQTHIHDTWSMSHIAFHIWHRHTINHVERATDLSESLYCLYDFVDNSRPVQEWSIRLIDSGVGRVEGVILQIKISAVSNFLEAIHHISLPSLTWHFNKFSRANSLWITFSYYSQNRKSNIWCIDFHKCETCHCLNQGTIFAGERRLQFT